MVAAIFLISHSVSQSATKGAEYAAQRLP